ncbi:serine hydrolase [Chryseobacterium jejuense]|uniref:Beta-lactamase n=1 Tax=Chryseobacterium jejuense TaxID=445960 RepID=A0A2X2VAR2_CHRJE|nr:serine hydrolase [Chryseobacterium jejuense]SDJ11853.1 CubicO group peptidase, beta-lactamase class C family [Chryseobacterium jejuense]SQB27942.1 Beta-lactamase [Chryseobacterium jejuense]
MTKLRLSLLIITITTLFTSSHLSGQITSKEVDILVNNAIEKFHVAGAAVAIVKDGKVIHKKGYGVKSIDTKSPIDEHTNFEIASNSKAFTTAALSILVDEGKISWDDHVKKYIPEFKMYNDYVTENFTIEDLLCHRSGLGLGAGDLMMFPDGTDFTINDVIKSFQYFTPVSAFRTQFNYDNQLYLVAGEVIARVSGMNWETFVQKRIMDPLQMQNTFSSISHVKDLSLMASPHSSESGSIKKISLYGAMVNGAAGGIVSNVDDMSKWMLVQLHKGKYGSGLEKQLFTKERQNEMWTIHTVDQINPNPRYNQHFNGYGLGWNLSDIKGNLSVSHTGGLPGMLSVVTMIPDLNLGIVILTNTENGGSGVFSSVSQTIIDSYLGLNDMGWVDKYAAYFKSQKESGDEVTKKVWETVSKAKNTTIKNEDLIGLYEDKWFGKIEIFLQGNQLWFKSYRSPKLNGPMSFYKANTFAIKWDYKDMNCDALAMFNLDEEGKAQSIKMKGISPNIDFSFDFQDLNLQRVKK